MNADPQPTDWRSIAIVWLAGTVASLALLKVSPAALDLRTGLSLSLSQLAWVSSIFTLMTVALGVFVGGWGVRFGARNVASLGLVMLAIAGAATTLAAGPTALIIGRLVEGTGFVLVVVCAPTLIASLAHPGDGRLVLGIWAVYVPAGGIVVMLAAPFLLPIGGWRALWWLGALFAVAALALLTRVPAPPKADRRSPGQSAAGIRTTKTLVISRWVRLYHYAAIRRAAVCAHLFSRGARLFPGPVNTDFHR